MSQVKLEHLYKRFGNVTAVGDFNLEVQDGEFVSFLGPSGCGKSTTLRMIAGFERPTEGNILLGDQVVSSAESNVFVPPEKRNIGMVFQSYAVWPHMTVAENVAYPLKIQKVPREERDKRVKEALEMVHLDRYGERYPSQLSGGQQQRVALARALIAQPGLLLLDEPLSNLDAKLRESMRFEISSLQKRLGITVIYVTHDQSEAMTMSDRIVVMNAGVVQQVGKPYDVYTHPANKMVADFIGLVNFLPAEVKEDRIFVKGTQVSFPNTAGLPRGDAVLGVRPENITLSKTGGMLQGQVKHRFYMGDAVDYRIQVGQQVLRVITHGSSYHQWADGETIYLDLNAVIPLGNEKNNYIIT
ncbi:ABC transporter ATP-binding protein [Acidaminococcus timonensis]|uniref:ABC transporter ATP-binding protein n=1 Tax=Acidaminococcus timonensis TaxID=1871002 RepID=UPI0026EA94D7|nr:ABC transporter ATP-binding protein [Acidaminococcus timonensis]